MSSCSAISTIENVSQFIANLIQNPSAFASNLPFLLQQVELIKGVVRNLPLAAGPKFDILGRLDEVSATLQNATLPVLQRLTIALQLLQLVVLKIQSKCLPCPQGQTFATTTTFNTSCHKCC